MRNTLQVTIGILLCAVLLAPGAPAAAAESSAGLAPAGLVPITVQGDHIVFEVLGAQTQGAGQHLVVVQLARQEQAHRAYSLHLGRDAEGRSHTTRGSDVPWEALKAWIPGIGARPPQCSTTCSSGTLSCPSSCINCSANGNSVTCEGTVVTCEDLDDYHDEFDACDNQFDSCMSTCFSRRDPCFLTCRNQFISCVTGISHPTSGTC